MGGGGDQANSFNSIVRDSCAKLFNFFVRGGVLNLITLCGKFCIGFVIGGNVD